MNVKINLYNPYPKQAEVHRALEDDNIKVVTVCAGRQVGKSLLAQNACLKFALVNKGVKVCVVSPSEAQALKFYSDINNAMGNSKIVTKRNGGLGNIQITFLNKSQIQFKSAKSEDTIRGNTFDMLCLDEAAFIKESTFQNILLPTINTSTHKKVLICSTPRGKNWFYKYWKYGQSTEPRHAKYKSFQFSSYENPLSDRDFIEMCKNTLPKALFEQEFLAQFIDNTSVFNNVNQWCVLNRYSKVSTEHCYIGVDLALQNDNTVITVMNGNLEMVDQIVMNRVTAPEVKLRIMQTINTYKPVMTIIESNSLGQAIIDELEYEGVTNILSFYTTNATKNDIVTNLMYLSESGKIKVWNDNELKDELLAFSVKQTDSGALKFAAVAGFKDDRVMSLAFAAWCHKLYHTVSNGNDFSYYFL